jgi:hypothetical protein
MISRPPEGVSGKRNAMHFVIAGFLVGVLLGLLRFKVFVLVPIILIAARAIIVTGHELKVIALTILATVVLLEIGYLVGCAARVYADAHLRARKHLATGSQKQSIWRNFLKS